MSDNMNNIFSQLSQKLGMSADQIKSSAQSGNVNNLLQNADRGQKKQIEEILSDPEKTKQLLNSPQAQAIIKMLNSKK